MFGRDLSEAIIVKSESEPHPSTGQPVGLPVNVTPARRPGPVTLEGRYGRVATVLRLRPGGDTSGQRLDRGTDLLLHRVSDDREQAPLSRHRSSLPLARDAIDPLSRAKEAPPAQEMLHVFLLAATSHFATITHFVFMMRDVRPRGVGAA